MFIGKTDVIAVLAGIGHDGFGWPQIISDGLFQKIFKHVGQHGFAGTRPPHHKDVPPVLGNFSDGPFGAVLKDNAVNRVVRKLDLGRIFELPQALFQICRIIQ